jgi:heme-degrading monooxygenase HmoA
VVSENRPFADLPEPPYTAVIFSSVRTITDDAGYAEMAAAMDDLARLQPGFLGVESARDHTRFGMTVSYWRTADDARAWKGVADHLAAQRLGRAEWYEGYRVRIAVVERAYGA